MIETLLRRARQLFLQIHAAPEKPYLTLTVLTVGGLLVFAGTWYGSQRVSQEFARLHSEREAKVWAHKAISRLSRGKATFQSATLNDNDKASLDQLLSASSIYRHVLFGPDGKVFWSSKTSKIGLREKRAYFSDVVAKGKVYTNHDVKPAHEIEGIFDTTSSVSIGKTPPATLQKFTCRSCRTENLWGLWRSILT